MKLSLIKKGQALNQNSEGECASCKYAIRLMVTKDFLCSRCGIVDEDYRCGRYKINHLIKRTPRKRPPLGEDFKNKFTREDFSIL